MTLLQKSLLICRGVYYHHMLSELSSKLTISGNAELGPNSQDSWNDFSELWEINLQRNIGERSAQITTQFSDYSCACSAPQGTKFIENFWKFSLLKNCKSLLSEGPELFCPTVRVLMICAYWAVRWSLLFMVSYNSLK